LRSLKVIGALGQERAARCGHCAKETPIPEEYTALQRAARSFAEDRTLAHQLYGIVGKPPGRFAYLVGTGFDGTSRVGATVVQVLVAMFVMPVMGQLLPAALAYVLCFPVGKLIRLACFIAGHPIEGGLPASLVVMITLFVGTPLIALPTIWFRKEQEIAGVRRDIHASLAAKLPERPGGPSRCRNCGGALDVPRGALGVPCTYCKADNLVALPETLVTRVRKQEYRHFLRIDSALAAYREASNRARDRRWKVAFYFLFVIPVVFVLAWILDAFHVSY
jgi:LSD1 subclass zinc finger protein